MSLEFSRVEAIDWRVALLVLIRESRMAPDTTLAAWVEHGPCRQLLAELGGCVKEEPR